MIRQAHTYLAGAVSGTALVAAAIVAFVLLVSLQALRDWPLAGISIGGGDSSVSAPSSSGSNSATPAEAGAAGAAPAAAGASGRPAGGGGNRAAGAQGNQAAPTPAAGSPAAETPSSSPAGQAGGGGSDSSPSGTASSSPQPTGGGGGGGKAPSTPAGGGGSSSSGSGGPSTSGAVTGTVNKTVSGVDEATGGVVRSTGATKVTEEVVNGVAGPESTVGHTVDEVVKTVNCLLGCKP